MGRLYRSRTQRMIAGVAGGMAEYFDVDVTMVRLLWLLALLFGGGGLIAYIMAWIVVPEQEKVMGNLSIKKEETGNERQEGEQSSEVEHPFETPITPEEQQTRDRRRRYAGLILVGLGLVFLAREVLPWYISKNFWPILLIVLGLWFLMRDKKEQEK